MRKALSALVMAALLLPGISYASNEDNTQSVDQKNVIAIDDITRGSMVTVRGVVQRIMDTDEFRLADETGDIVVYIGWQNFVPVDVGDKVTVKGFVDNDSFLELYAREIIHSDGRVTLLKHDE